MRISNQSWKRKMELKSKLFNLESSPNCSHVVASFKIFHNLTNMRITCFYLSDWLMCYVTLVNMIGSCQVWCARSCGTIGRSIKPFILFNSNNRSKTWNFICFVFHNWACDDQESKEYSFQYFITFFLLILKWQDNQLIRNIWWPGSTRINGHSRTIFR